MEGMIVPTQVDSEVAKLQQPHKGKTFAMTIDRVEPERFFSFRWHPFAIDPAVDYDAEPATLVVFELSEVPGGTRITITESGFDGVPLARRATAFAANEGGWEHQTRLIAKYLSGPA